MRPSLLKVTTQQHGFVSLSQEEMALAITENDEAGTELAQAVNELEHSEQLAQGVEDVGVIVGLDPASAQTNAALLNVVGDMMVAGTDADPAELLPLPDTGEAIIMEGFVDVLRRIWDSIVAAIKNIWNGITNYFSQFFNVFKGIEERVKKVREYWKTCSGKVAPNRSIAVRGNEAAVEVNGRKSNDLGDDLVKVLNFCETLFTQLPKNLLFVGDVIQKGIQNSNLQDPDGSAETLIHALQPAMKNYLNTFSRAYPSSGGGFDSWSGSFLGNMSVVINSATSEIMHDKPIADGSAMQALHDLSQIKVHASYYGNTSGTTASYNIRVMNHDQLGVVLSALEEYCSYFGRYKNADGGGFSADMKKHADGLKAATDNLLKSARQGGSDSAKRYAKSVMRLNTAYATWCTNPLVKLAKHTLSMCHTYLNIVENSLKEYE